MFRDCTPSGRHKTHSTPPQHRRWGGFHYLITGKDAKGAVQYVGGWQNNRSSELHKEYRMVENIFEELDAAGEWFHNAKEKALYYMPAEDVALASAMVEVVRLRHLTEIKGQVKQPIAQMPIPDPGNELANLTVPTPETTQAVKWIEFQGLRFAGAKRTFMDTREPLLRSDWTVYRGGAVSLRGTENVTISNCTFEELGGNAVFVDGYNRKAVIRGNLFKNNGATEVSFVGSFGAVRSPRFSYNNTIFDTPRAAINICDGTWGGHLIAWNECFDTVLETHDHGAFNSWGRDRYWHSAG